MDAFLRRVAVQRELEQEADILAIQLSELAAPPCRVCGGTVYATEPPQLTVCTACGGRKREARLQREELERQRDVQWKSTLLALAGFDQVPTMSAAAERKCASCGKKLRSDNTTDTCTACKVASRAPRAEGAGPPSPSPRNGDVRKRFRVVSEALGFNGDQLIEAFCQGWLERVRSSVRLPGDDELGAG